ncbi:MAG: NADH-quinone oxidoreductase subunit C [Verrucomicrobia bacterium]|nr:MAG: NADH-quinone oxidoreductase subunit C [Verrucomicrobiota bacterium]
MTGQEALVSLSKSFGEKIQNKIEFRGETTFTITADDLREIARFCRDELSFDYLIDITSIDNFGKEPRFEIVYELYSMPGAAHLRLKLKVSEDVGVIDTVCDIWPTANWHEREIYDMMGIKFNEGLPSEMPDVAFTKVTPMEGGPFVTRPSTATSKDREPRAHPPDL